MKYLIAFAILILSLTIYFKPIANRYIFEDIEQSHIDYIVKDTATGKIYKWSLDSSLGVPSIYTYDIVNNKYIIYKNLPMPKLIDNKESK